LQALPKEENRIIRQWRYIGQQVHSAADSQALLHLYQTYCESSRCLHCAVWSEITDKTKYQGQPGYVVVENSTPSQSQKDIAREILDGTGE